MDVTKKTDAFHDYADAPTKSPYRAEPHSATVVDSVVMIGRWGGGEGICKEKMLGRLLKLLFANKSEKQ
jgi:hypothetical protein